jgi:hypothetical protein
MMVRWGCVSLGVAIALGAAGIGGAACSSGSSSAGPSSSDDGGVDAAAAADGGAPDGPGVPEDAQAPLAMIGVSGGTVSAPGVLLTIPPGSLTGNTPVAIATTAEVPSGYTALSPVYTFEPPGTTLLVPATVDITLATQTTPGVSATVFLSNDAGGFDGLVTMATASTASASIVRLGDCFAGLPPGVSNGGDDAGALSDSGGGADSGSADGSAGQ